MSPSWPLHILLLLSSPLLAAETPDTHAAPSPAPTPSIDITRPSLTEQANAALQQLAALPRPDEARWLETPNGRFLALVLPATTQRVLGTILLLPEPGEAPDAPVLLAPLRQELARLGWSSWSLALKPEQTEPAPAKPEAGGEIWRPGLAAALAEIRKSESRAVFLMARGETGLALLARPEDLPEHDGLILLDVRPETGEAERALNTQLTKRNRPLLDIVAAQDGANPALALRKSAGEQAPADAYRQLTLVGTDHRLIGYTGFIAHAVHGWARRHRPPETLSASQTTNKEKQ